MTHRILIIDDEEPTVQLVAILLEKHEFEVVKAYRADDGLRKAYRHQPNLILLDIMMPDMDGWDVLRRLREMSDVPIVFLTARTDVKDIVRGLELGSDDYILKPYDNDELIARIKAHLRRAPRHDISEEMSFNEGRFRINFLNRELSIDNEMRHLTPKEFNLLAVLVRNAGKVVSRHELVQQAWGEENIYAVDSLKLYVHYLRQKIERNPNQPEYIVTSRGIGYRFMGK